MKKLFVLLLSLSFIHSFSQNESDSINVDSKINSYIEKAEKLVADEGSKLAKFLGKVRGHGFFKRLEKNLLDPVNVELKLLKDSDFRDNIELQRIYNELSLLHNSSIKEMQAEISIASGFKSVTGVSFRKIYKDQKKEIDRLATEFIDLSYNLRTNQEHAGIIDIVLIAFRVGKLIKKFEVQIEENAKPIIIENLEKRKLPKWDDIMSD